MAKQLLLIFFILACGNILLAQERIDIATISTRVGAPTQYFDIPGEDAIETELFANIKLPIVFGENTIWFNNISYSHFQVNNDLNLEAGIANPVRLNGLIIQTGLVQRINERKAIQLLFVPRYMGDYTNSGSETWQFGAIALYEVRHSEKLRMRYGFLFNQELFGLLLVPLFDFMWQISPRWSFTGLMPIYGKLGYAASDRLTVGLSHFGLITSFDLSKEEYANTYLERTSIDLAPFARFELFDDFFIEGRIGYALGRNYDQYPNEEQIGLRLSIIRFNDMRGNPINEGFRDGLFASLRLVYSIEVP
jgi:hypothetical protein